MNDATTITPTQEPAQTTETKRTAARYYVRDGEIIRREAGKPDTVMTRIDALGVQRERLVIEGFIAQLIRGATPEDILSGKAIPDRDPPAERVAKERPATMLQRAIAAVREKALTKAARDRGEKPDRAAIAAQALADARALTPEQLKQAEKHPDVQRALIDLRGGGGSLDELFGKPAETEGAAP